MTDRQRPEWEYLICYSFDRGVSADSWIFGVCGTQRKNSLKGLGENGWELAGVTADGEKYIFKRPREPQSEPGSVVLGGIRG